MGVVVQYDSCPHDLMISNLDRIDIVVPTRPLLRPPPLASELRSSASSAVHVPRRRGPRTPSRSLRRTLTRAVAAPFKAKARPAQVGTTTYIEPDSRGGEQDDQEGGQGQDDEGEVSAEDSDYEVQSRERFRG